MTLNSISDKSLSFTSRARRVSSGTIDVTSKSSIWLHCAWSKGKNRNISGSFIDCKNKRNVLLEPAFSISNLFYLMRFNRTAAEHLTSGDES